MTSYSIDVIQAAGRVGRIFDEGFDRCDLDDLELLEKNKLMTRSRAKSDCLDTIEKGETIWTFNEAGEALVDSILDKPKQ